MTAGLAFGVALPFAALPLVLAAAFLAGACLAAGAAAFLAAGAAAFLAPCLAWAAGAAFLAAACALAAKGMSSSSATSNLMPTSTIQMKANPSAKPGEERASPARSRGRYFSLLHVATVVAPRTTDHLLSSTLTSVKQVGLLPFQLVQKPSLLSFHVPSPLTPAARL